MTRALILSGGGARAAYQVGVLKALAEILPDGMDNPFPVICGTSAGAINAATLAAHEGSFQEAAAELEKIWLELEPDDVYRCGWADMITNLMWIVASLVSRKLSLNHPVTLLDNAPLRSLIRRTVHFNQIDRNIGRGTLQAVSITAMGYNSGESVSFFQAEPDVKDWQRYRRLGRRTLLNADHLMASSAIPTIFPTVKIEHEYFGDGALRQLAPISPALHLGADKVFIIGVSSNRDAQPTQKQKTATRYPPSVAQVVGHLLNSAFVDSLEGDMERLERGNQLLTLVPEEIRKRENIPLKHIEELVISPSKAVEDIAEDKERDLPSSLRFLLRNIGATTKGGGASAASYLLFAHSFVNELISLGYKDTMWEKARILHFFERES